MNDLIDREDAYIALVEKGQASRRYKLGEIWELNGKEIREVLDSVPSAQRNGKWMPGKETGRSMIGDAVVAIYYDHFTCSYCGRVYNTEQKPTWKFCPNCGSYNGGDESLH